jgi:serine/threonine-protein kinase
VVAALAVGLSIALWQARAAREEAARSNTIKDFVLSIIQQADPVASQQTRAADLALLAAAEQRVVRELDGRPELQLQMRQAIATAFRNRGDWEQARRVLRTAIEEARQTLPSDHIDFLHARVLLADLPLSDGAGALEELEAAIAGLRRLGGKAVPALIDGLLARLSTLKLWEQSSPESAFADGREAIALAKRTFEPNHPKIIEASSEYTLLLLDDGRPEEALGMIEPIYRLASESPILGTGHLQRLQAQSLYGRALCATGRFDDGLTLLREAADLARTHHGSDSRVLRIALTNWAVGLFVFGDLRRSIEAQREAHAIAVLLEPLGNPNRAGYATDLAFVLNAARRPHEAMHFLEEAAQARKAWPSGAIRDARDWWGMRHLAFTYVNLGETERAQQIAKVLLQQVDTEKYGDLLISILWDLARAIRMSGNAAEAEPIAERLVSRVRADSRILSNGIGFVGELGMVKLELGKVEEAFALLDEAKGLKRRSLWIPTDAAVHLALGRALLELQRAAEAQTLFAKVDAFWREFDPDHPLAAEAAWWLGQSLVATGEPARGKALLAEARPRLAASWLPQLRPLATAPAPFSASADTKVARD